MINIKDLGKDTYSLNDEDYHNLDSIHDDNLNEGSIVHFGEQDTVYPSDFFSIDNLLEQMQDCADCSEFGEYTEDWFSYFNDKSLEPLTNEISKLLNEHLPKPRFYRVINTVKYRIVKIEDGEVFVEEVEK